MNMIFQRALKLLGTRLLFVVLSVFFLMPFSWLIKFEQGFLYYSILSSIFYLGYIYSDIHSAGASDIRKKCAHPANGFLAGAFSEVVTILIIVVLLIVQGGGYFRNINIAFIVWVSPFIGFLNLPAGEFLNMASITPNYFFVTLPVPIVSALGYIAGMRSITILANRKCIKDNNDDN